jgi:hypothetical protein
MRSQLSRRQSTLSFAAALALLALAAPATSARPVEQFLGPQSSETACDRSGELHGTTTTCEQQALARAGQGPLDYSKNSVSGEYAPALPRTVETATTTDNPGFDWGAAAIGAGAAITLLLLGSVAVLALIARGRVRLAR